MELDAESPWHLSALPLYRLDPQGCPLALNQAMVELLGGIQDLRAVPPPVRLPGDAADPCRRLWRVSAAGGRVLSACERRDAAGQTWGVVLNADAGQEVPVPSSTAAERDEELLALAHDLRSPLNAILGFADVLMHAQTDGEAGASSSAARHIAAAGERLLLKLDGLIDLSRLRVNRLPLSFGPVQPWAIWTQVMEQMGPDLRLREVRIDAQAPPDGVPALLQSDPVRVQQLMAQLLCWMLQSARPGQQLLVHWDFEASGTWRWQLEGPCPTAFVQDRLGTNAMVRTLCQLLAERLGGRFTVHSADGALGRMQLELPAQVAPRAAAVQRLTS